MSNLALACRVCNHAKGNRTATDYLSGQPERLATLLAQAQAPLRDAAAVNATRWVIWHRLTASRLPVEASTGGRTKWNRHRFGIPKTHALDAACAGQIDGLAGWQIPTLTIQCTGRGSHQRTRLTAHGFPRGYLMRQKTLHGFRTGDLVQAVVPTGQHAGSHTGRVAVRASGSFNLQTSAGTLQGIAARHCQLLQHADGYGYYLTPRLPLAPPPSAQAEGVRGSARVSHPTQVTRGGEA